MKIFDIDDCFFRLASSDDFEKSRAKTSPLQIDLSTPQRSFSAANPNRTSKRRQTTVYRKKTSTKDRNEIFTAWNPLKDGDIWPSELLKMCAKVYGPRGSIYRTVCWSMWSIKMNIILVMSRNTTLYTLWLYFDFSRAVLSFYWLFCIFSLAIFVYFFGCFDFDIHGCYGFWMFRPAPHW